MGTLFDEVDFRGGADGFEVNEEFFDCGVAGLELGEDVGGAGSGELGLEELLDHWF